MAEFHHVGWSLPGNAPVKNWLWPGDRNLSDRPNVLRAVLGDSGRNRIQPNGFVELQTNIDDLSPEILGAVQDRLFQAGALDVFFTPIQMKKNRPATMLSVLCQPSALAKNPGVIFTETSTFGIRYREMNRKHSGPRSRSRYKTVCGPIQIKIGRHDGKILQVAPEFESCNAAAQRSQQPSKARSMSSRLKRSGVPLWLPGRILLPTSKK